MIDGRKLIETFKDMALSWGEMHDKESKYRRFDMEEIERVVNNQPQIGEWIPCEKRLPTLEECAENDCRFILDDGARRYEGYFMPANGIFVKPNPNEEGTVDDKFVRAWQPLPKRYKEK